MPTFSKFTFASLALAAIASAATAATPQTLTTIAQQAEVLVVAEVTAIDQPKLPAFLDPSTPAPKRATLKILRGLYPANNSPVEAEQLTIQLPTTNADPLSPGQVALFPLKHVGENWQPLTDGETPIIMPAAAHLMNFDAPDARLLLFRELAGAFAYGSFDTQARAGRFLDALGGGGPDKESPVQPVYALILNEVGDSALREDPRWVQIAAATYTALDSSSRPTFGALLDGNLPDSKGLRLAALALRKTSRFQLDQRLLMTLINHQNDPGWAVPIASALAANFSDNPAMLAMEREALKDGKSGALQVADALITSRISPLAPTAADAARAALIPAPDTQSTLDLAGTKAAFALFLRLANDEAFAAFQERIAQSSQTDPAAYQTYLELAGGGGRRDDFPTPRILEICRYYIDDTTALTTPPANAPDYRLCDQAAATISRITKQDFNFKPSDPVATRDSALDRIRNYLRNPR